MQISLRACARWIFGGLVALSCTVPGAVAGAADADPTLAGLQEIADTLAQAGDNPRAALRAAELRLSAAGSDAERRFWTLLAQSRALGLLEQAQPQALAVAAAEQELGRMPQARAEHRAALKLQQLYALASSVVFYY